VPYSVIKAASTARGMATRSFAFIDSLCRSASGAASR
jgi:hypothetical protein